MLKGFPIVITVCLSSFLLVGALGRAATMTAPETKTAPLTSQELQARLKPYLRLKSLDADFVQKKHLADLAMDLPSSGHLSVKKPGPVVWTVLKPSFLEVRITGRDLTMTSMKDGARSEQKISFDQMGSEQGSKGLALLVPWLEMDVEKLLARYTITQTAPDQLRFVPKTGALFKEIGMKLAPNGHLQRLSFSEQNGDSIEIDFKAAKIQNQ